jgi:PBP1b-binding outer membrane lipoprotein LpoB
MKKNVLVLAAVIAMFLSGCSLLNDAKDTLTYVNDAKNYLDKATAFANDAPSIAQQAVSDRQATAELKTMLQNMKQEIQAFNKLQAPDVAADLHQQIVDQNNKLVAGIDLYLKNMKNGLLDPSVLENTEIFQSVQEINGILDQIKQLGQ